MSELKTIKVCDTPPTWIVIDAQGDEAKARAHWQQRHRSVNGTLTDEQRRREFENVRKGRTEQRRHYK